MDGTLVDSNWHHAPAWARAFRSAGLSAPLWRIHRHIGMGGDQLVPAVAGDEAERRSGDAVRAAHDLLGARDLVDGWTTADDVDRTTPAPDVIRAAMGRLGGAEAAVVVGDTVWDCLAAGRAGLPSVAVLTGGVPEADLREAGAVAVHATLGALMEHLHEPPLTSRAGA